MPARAPAHLGDQALEALAIDRTGAGTSEIAIDYDTCSDRHPSATARCCSAY